MTIGDAKLGAPKASPLDLDVRDAARRARGIIKNFNMATAERYDSELVGPELEEYFKNADAESSFAYTVGAADSQGALDDGQIVGASATNVVRGDNTEGIEVRYQTIVYDGHLERAVTSVQFFGPMDQYNNFSNRAEDLRGVELNQLDSYEGLIEQAPYSIERYIEYYNKPDSERKDFGGWLDQIYGKNNLTEAESALRMVIEQKHDDMLGAILEWPTFDTEEGEEATKDSFIVHMSELRDKYHKLEAARLNKALEWLGLPTTEISVGPNIYTGPEQE